VNYLGIDPAKGKHQALACVSYSGDLVDFCAIKMSGNVLKDCYEIDGMTNDFLVSTGEDFKAVVESQEIYKGQANKQKSIIKLANYAGMITQAVGSSHMCDSIEYVLPKDWTNREKKANQYWICKRLGFSDEDIRTTKDYSVPKVLLGEKRVTILADVLDAIGLAFWLYDKDKKDRRRREILGK
tara:strand:- start:71094 stop:71645 length:552 start_codon:yes stop_codon:yes gene_type:complete